MKSILVDLLVQGGGEARNWALVVGRHLNGGLTQQWKLQKVDTNHIWPLWMICSVKTGGEHRSMLPIEKLFGCGEGGFEMKSGGRRGACCIGLVITANYQN